TARSKRPSRAGMAWKGAKLYRSGRDGLNHVLHECEIQRLDGIRRSMVIRISEVGGIGEHDRRIPVMPEGCMVASPGIRQLLSVSGNHQGDGLQIAGVASHARFDRCGQLL